MKQLLLIVAATLALTASALAQPADSAAANKIPVARRMYDEGVDAVNKGRWSVAHDRFKASYELAPRVLTLFNLAGAQAQTGRLVEAAESYRRFLRETTDGRYPEFRADATTQLDALEKQVAQVTLDVTNVDAADVIMVDEIEYPHAAIREPIPMNPGPHVARIKRGDALVGSKSITLSPGAAETVRIELPVKTVDLTVRKNPDASPPGVTGTAALDGKQDDHESKGGVLRSPWFWGAVAVVVVGGAVGAYVLTRDDGTTLVVK
jgi:hypothetical protein